MKRTELLEVLIAKTQKFIERLESRLVKLQAEYEARTKSAKENEPA